MIPRFRAVAFYSLAMLALSSASGLAMQSSQEETLQQYSEAGQRALAAGHYEEAESDFKKLLQIAPDIAEMHATLGLVYFQDKKFDQAVPELKQALKLKPALTKRAHCWPCRFPKLGSTRKRARAAEVLPTSTGSGDETDVRPAIDANYTGLQRDKDAVTVALELNRVYPDDPEILYHTGRVYGNYAFLTLHKLEVVAPTSIWRHQAAAEAFESVGSTNLSIGEYREVLSLDPRRPNIHYRIGRTLLARWQLNHAPEDKAEAAKRI